MFSTGHDTLSTKAVLLYLDLWTRHHMIVSQEVHGFQGRGGK